MIVLTMFLFEVCGFGYCNGLYMLSPDSGTIRRCALVGVGVALMKEVCHCGDGL